MLMRSGKQQGNRLHTKDRQGKDGASYSWVFKTCLLQENLSIL